MTHALQGWIDGERLWFHHVKEDISGGWGGILEMLSLMTLVAVSALGWLGVLVILIRSV